MPTNISKQQWNDYCKQELNDTAPTIEKHGFTIDKEQVHIGGERYLMASARDVGGGGCKLVLTGRQKNNGKRVVMKVSGNKAGVKEIEQERKAREVLHRINFAYRTFFTPEEILFKKWNSHIVFITNYIEQDRAFITRNLDEQFFLALRALETQEGVHVTTYSHAEVIKNVFGMADAKYYFNSFEEFSRVAAENDPKNKKLLKTMQKALVFLRSNKTIIDRYCGFLTHSDFVPNNLRVSGNNLFLLDYASIHFGNKYESWARFLNFMIHHNRPLEMALTDYVRQNRGADEYLSLRLMRVYKLGFLLQFYAKALHRTSGNLHRITELRINFWTNVMALILEDKPIPQQMVLDFTKKEDSLRSEDEIRRQEELLGGKRLV